MKKGTRILSLVIAFSLIISLFSGTVAFAETTPTTITSLDGFDQVTQVELSSITRYELEVNNPDIKLTASTSDDGIMSAYIKEDADVPGDYQLSLTAWKTGEATVTITASDGTTVSQKITIADTGAERTYTISADTSEDFTLAKGSSRVIRIDYSDVDVNHFSSYPVLTTDDQENSLKVKLLYVDYYTNSPYYSYYYRVDAVGDVGQTGQLYMGSSDYVPDKLCTVTIGANKNLRIDTAAYVCNFYDTYRFVVYTSSATPPEVTSFNDMLPIEYLGKANGGYEYRMEADVEGESLIQATSNGETATFPVTVNYNDPPSVQSDSPKSVQIAQGSSYTYKLSIMGGGEPKVVAGTDGVLSIQLVQKDGINYYYKVSAVGAPASSSSLTVTFPNGGDESFNVDIGKVSVTEPKGIVMKSDTNTNFSMKKGSSYMFKITGATSFYPGSSGVFKVEQVSKSGSDTFFRITATGNPGQQAGFYMSAPNQTPQKVCVVTVAQPDPIVMKSDTNTNFSVKKGSSYMFKITGATSFYTGSSGVFKVEQVSKSGNDTFFRITATGNPGQQTGLYMSAPNQTPQKVCVVTVAQPDPVVMKSDTNTNFSLKKGSSYMFKITGATSFYAGSSGVFKVDQVSKSGNDTYFRITATGNKGQQAGFYMSVPSQSAQKVCIVTVS